MELTNYKEIDVLIEPKDGAYKVRVSAKCGGDGSTTFALDDLSFALASSKLTPSNTLPSSTNQSGTNNISPELDTNGLPNHLSLIQTRPPSLAEARAFGQQLFNVIFQGSNRLVFDRCLGKAQKDKTQLRFWLHLTDVPELSSLPWEFLCLVPQQTFFGTAYDSIVRYLNVELSFDESPLTEPPLRILAVLSNPKGAPTLNVDEELKKLQAVVSRLEGVVIEPLYKPTIKSLRKRLHEHRETDPYHVFHYIGHAVFDASTKEGKLLLENGAGGINQISGQELGGILATHRSLRLAVINACEGARTSAKDSYSGVAQTLLRSGAAPKVIAMQYAISDDAGQLFAQSFYEQLLKGNDLDTSVALARMSISDTEQEEGVAEFVEWGTPVIYMRAKDSRLVSFSTVSQQQLDELPYIPTPSDPDLLDVHCQEVVKTLSDGQLVPFLGLNINLFNQQSHARPPAYDELVAHVVGFGEYPYSPVGLPGVSQYAQLPNRLAKLYDKLNPLLDDKGFEPTELHKFWANVALAQTTHSADIALKRAPFLIVTTNYDTLLEKEFIRTVKDFHVLSYIAEGSNYERGKFFVRHYHQGQPAPPILVDNNNKEINDVWPVILKLPGSIEPFNSKIRFAITEDQYFELLTNRDLMSILPSQVMTKLRGSSHLFLGWTLSDWSLRGMLYRIWEKPSPPYDSWTVQTRMTQFERKYWEACQVQIIEEDLASYIARLKQHLLSAQTTA